MKAAGQALRYGATGALNTLVGLAVIYGCLALGIGDVAANVAGYAVGLALSYFLNARWTFRFRGDHARSLPRFLGVFAVAYGANLAALLLARPWTNAYIAQLVGVAVYTVVGFLGSRHFAFAR